MSNQKHQTMLRLYQIAKTSKHSQIAKDLNLSPSVITNWAKRGVSKEGALKATEVYGGDANYILLGKKDEISNFRPISEWDEDTPLDGDEVEIPYYKTLAFACGHGNENLITEDEELRKLRMSRFTLQRLGIYRDNTFSATADGDSMSPTINDGNTIFVDKGRTTIKDGKIFAVSYGGLHYCKRLYNLPNGGIRVVSDNKEEFPEFELTKKEIEEQEFVIIGWIYHWSNTERW